MQLECLSFSYREKKDLSSYAAGIVTASVKGTQQKKAPKGEDATHTEFDACCQQAIYIISCRKWSNLEPVTSGGDGGEKWQLLTGKEAGQETPAEAQGQGPAQMPLMQKKVLVLRSSQSSQKLPEPTSHPNREYCFKGCSRHRSSQISAAG